MARTFKSVFVEEQDSSNNTTRWRIKGSGVQTHPTDAKLTEEVVECLEGSGISVQSSWSGSPGNAVCYELEASFEDGGLYASTGNYWYQQRGAWINGERAVIKLAQLLGLRKIPVVDTGLKQPT